MRWNGGGWGGLGGLDQGEGGSEGGGAPRPHSPAPPPLSPTINNVNTSRLLTHTHTPDPPPSLAPARPPKPPPQRPVRIRQILESQRDPRHVRGQDGARPLDPVGGGGYLLLTSFFVLMRLCPCSIAPTSATGCPPPPDTVPKGRTEASRPTAASRVPRGMMPQGARPRKESNRRSSGLGRGQTCFNVQQHSVVGVGKGTTFCAGARAESQNRAQVSVAHRRQGGRCRGAAPSPVKKVLGLSPAEQHLRRSGACDPLWGGIPRHFCRCDVCRCQSQGAPAWGQQAIGGTSKDMHRNQQKNGTVSRGQGCIRREGTPEAAREAVGQAVGGGCRSGWGPLLLVTNAIEAGTCRQGEYPGRPGAPPPPPSNASLPGGMRHDLHDSTAVLTGPILRRGFGPNEARGHYHSANRWLSTTGTTTCGNQHVTNTPAPAPEAFKHALREHQPLTPAPQVLHTPHRCFSRRNDLSRSASKSASNTSNCRVIAANCSDLRDNCNRTSLRLCCNDITASDCAAWEQTSGVMEIVPPIMQCKIMQNHAKSCKIMHVKKKKRRRSNARHPPPVHQYNCHPPPQLASFYLLPQVINHCHHHQSQQCRHRHAHLMVAG